MSSLAIGQDSHEILGKLRIAWRRAVPPARLLAISLAVLAGYACYVLHGLGLGPLLVVPVLAGTLDLGFERVRFEGLRVPDAGIATGLLVAVLLPPTTPLLVSGAVATVAVAAKHVLRFRGRPWLNPSATGVVVGSAAFALQPAWWAVVSPIALYLCVGLGVTLIVARASPWRLPASFLITYGAFAALLHAMLGAALDPRVLVLQAVDPVTVFFAFFMMAEPRAAPADPAAQVLYAGVVGIVGALSSLLFPALDLLVALLIGNLLALALRWRTAAANAPTYSLRGKARVGVGRTGSSVPARWSIGRRVAAGLVVLIALSSLVASSAGVHTPTLPPGGGSGGTTLTGCTHDNPAIPASTLAQLHHMLGPSVIRSYNASTGVVVFYDPVNHVTVTETDLFEDYGYAEFNGDDFAVSGCS